MVADVPDDEPEIVNADDGDEGRMSAPMNPPMK